MDTSVLLRFRQRKLVQWALAYLAGAWLVIQVIDGLSDAFDWPPVILRCLWVALGFGFPIALVLAWYHGEKGAQRVGSVELLMLSTILVAAGSAVAFVGERARVEAAAEQAASAFTGTALFATAPPENSIAALPFTNMSSDKENEYFADGITEDVLTSLAKLSDLKVISRTSVMQYKGTTKTMRQIGAELGAAYILEGSVRRTGDRIRIVAQLIDTRTDEHLWAETYDRDLRDIFALQSEIAMRIAMSLRARLSPDDQRRLAAATARPVSPAAYEAYLRGQTGQDAVASYQRAIELDPGFAPPYAALANQHFFMAFFGVTPPAESFQKVEEYARLALQKDPDLADGHGALALVSLYRDWDWDAAERHFQHALRLSPSSVELRHFYAHYLMAMGRHEESAAETRWAAEVAPLDAMMRACSGWHGLPAREHQQAVQASLSALHMEPDSFWPEMILGWAYEQEGKLTEAIGAFQEAVEHSGGSSFAMAALGHAFAAAGQRSRAEAVLAELQSRQRTGYVSAYDIAGVYAGLGDRDRAFHWLQRAVSERSSFLVNVAWDERFRTVRSDPRFEQLVRAIGLPDAAGHRGPTS